MQQLLAREASDQELCPDYIERSVVSYLCLSGFPCYRRHFHQIESSHIEQGRGGGVEKPRRRQNQFFKPAPEDILRKGGKGRAMTMAFRILAATTIGTAGSRPSGAGTREAPPSASTFHLYRRLFCSVIQLLDDRFLLFPCLNFFSLYSRPQLPSAIYWRKKANRPAAAPFVDVIRIRDANAKLLSFEFHCAHSLLSSIRFSLMSQTAAVFACWRHCAEIVLSVSCTIKDGQHFMMRKYWALSINFPLHG